MVLNWAFKHLKTVSILGVMCFAGPSVLAERIVSEGKSGRLPMESDLARSSDENSASDVAQPYSGDYRPYREITDKVAVPVQRPQRQSIASQPCGSLTGDLCRMFQLTNKERSQAGLPSLKFDPNCQTAAQNHAGDMARRQYFNHQSPDGKNVQDRYPGRWKMIGENIAMGSHMDVNGAMTAWMRSPGHKRNILNSGFNALGVGIKVQNGKRYFVQCFSNI